LDGLALIAQFLWMVQVWLPIYVSIRIKKSKTTAKFTKKNSHVLFKSISMVSSFASVLFLNVTVVTEHINNCLTSCDYKIFIYSEVW
jgi:hypothetical protein